MIDDLGKTISHFIMVLEEQTEQILREIALQFASEKLHICNLIALK